MTTDFDARVRYDLPGGRRAVLFLGFVSSVRAAEKALRSAADEARMAGGTNLRLEMRDGAGSVVYSAKLPQL